MCVSASAGSLAIAFARDRACVVEVESECGPGFWSACLRAEHVRLFCSEAAPVESSSSVNVGERGEASGLLLGPRTKTVNPRYELLEFSVFSCADYLPTITMRIMILKEAPA